MNSVFISQRISGLFIELIRICQVEQKNMDFFSLLIIQDLTSGHSGEYTCRATNDFGTVSHSASLIVKGIYCLT